MSAPLFRQYGRARDGLGNRRPEPAHPGRRAVAGLMQSGEVPIQVGLGASQDREQHGIRFVRLGQVSNFLRYPGLQVFCGGVGEVFAEEFPQKLLAGFEGLFFVHISL